VLLKILIPPAVLVETLPETVQWLRRIGPEVIIPALLLLLVFPETVQWSKTARPISFQIPPPMLLETLLDTVLEMSVSEA
jgi:hypothetical protein